MNMKKFAEEALKAFKLFKTFGDHNDKKENMLFEATLAIIGCKLLQKDEKEAIVKLFKVMDESGDGKIGEDELIDGFKKVLNETITSEKA